ncbi:hypothetical protein A3H40_04380 [Candidatus Daviesbacteria bacterium RIFCSPLOWO2_02_FULL_38_15]|uniref:Uncharacterized protein n=1 Tax=Candidatus Daviesbacteria bacterium RIFCSPLOWO2_02_FULL_38_15 TaxID=1797794 RepID=A0A1F5N490_9BACT|nr:MAG: hypothetical protein A3H40_04380 [Candidatus Daviesbacteria bacterium RIFCSPLOWO2_02_FULL_38_15]
MIVELSSAGRGPEDDLVPSRQIQANHPVFPLGGSSNPGQSKPEPRLCSHHGGCLTTFAGKTREYTIKTIKSGAERGFVTKLDEDYFQVIPEHIDLVNTIADLYRRVYPERAKRNPKLTTKRVLKSLSNPRTILELMIFEDLLVGYGVFPRLDFGMTSTRAILAEHVQEGGGTYLLERAISLHKKEGERWGKPLRDGFLMTQRCESIRSLEKLQDRGIIGKIQPINEPFDAKGAGLLFEAHVQMRINSRSIELTGRSRRELTEVGYNENLEIPREGTRRWEIFQQIVSRPPEGAGINLFDGDTLYVRFIIPKSEPQLR